MYRYTGKWVYIDYFCKSKSGKTNIYQVISKRGDLLGDIKWFAKWRKYAFYPRIDTVYENDCLKDIANFIEVLIKYKKPLKRKIKVKK